MFEDVVVGVVVVLVGDVVVGVVVLVGVVVDGVVVVELGVLVGCGALEVVGRALLVGLPSGVGSIRSDGFSAIVRGTGSRPGLSAVGTAATPAPSFPSEPVRARAPPRAIAATAKAPAAATDRFRRVPAARRRWGCVGDVDPVGGVACRAVVRGSTGRRSVGAYAAVRPVRCVGDRRALAIASASSPPLAKRRRGSFVRARMMTSSTAPGTHPGSAGGSWRMC